MTKYEYFEIIGNNWSVHKHGVDIYLTTPVLSLIKDIDALLDNNDALYENFKEIRSILPITYRGGGWFKNVPVGAVMLWVNIDKPLGKTSMQDLLEDITIKLLILHFDGELFKCLTGIHGPSVELYDYISVTTNEGTSKIRPVYEYESDTIKDPYRLSHDYEDGDTNQYFISSFDVFNGVEVTSWKPEDGKLEIKKENDTMGMENIFDAICENWSYHEEPHGNGSNIYITTPVLSLIGDTDKLLDGVNELYKDCEWIKFITLEQFEGKFEFVNVPKGAMMIRIHVWNTGALKNLENNIAFRHVISFFDNKLREMTTDDLYSYIYADMDLASGEIRPVIDNGFMKDPYKLSFVNKDEDEYEYDKQEFLTSFKALDGITVYHWVPKDELSCDKYDSVWKKDTTHPAHYDYKITPLDAAFEWYKDLPSDEAILAFNAVKYLARFHKKNGREDLEKAKTYIDFLIDRRANK